MTRYCKDCDYIRHRDGFGAQPYCNRFKREFIKNESPVFGPTVEFSAPDCVVARAEGGQCGPQGRFYIARAGTQAWLDEREAAKTKVLQEAHEELEPIRGISLWQRVRAWLAA